MKSKITKSLVDNLKGKSNDCKDKPKKKSRRKLQPPELNTGTFGETRMPKITQNTTHISELRSTYKVPYGHFQYSEKKRAKINKTHEITGWAQDDDKHKFFNVDLF